MNIYPDFDLKPYNTFAVSAKAKYFVECHTPKDLETLFSDEYFHSIPHLFIGRGSNLLFITDYEGAVIRYVGEDTAYVEDQDYIHVSVEAGRRWHHLVEEVASKGLWGIENLAAIPGDVGAAAVQNIGAYGVEICDVIEEIHTFSFKTGKARVFSRKECDYAYRYSIFKSVDLGDTIVYKVVFRLKKNGVPNLSYKGLSTQVKQEDLLSPTSVMSKVVSIRAEKLPDPAFYPNAGSFFMNPVIQVDQFQLLKAEFPTIPSYPMGDRVKVPAAWLIEQCGLKGKRYGAIGCYETQPLVIVKYEESSGEEIRDHAERVQSAVLAKFGVELSPEVRYVISKPERS